MQDRTDGRHSAQAACGRAVWSAVSAVAFASLLAAAALAQSPTETASFSGGIGVAAPGLFGESLRAQLEAMPEQGVKEFYARCSQEGMTHRLEGGEAMACSIGYDVLLQKYFGGDFERLLAWSRGRSN